MSVNRKVIFDDDNPEWTEEDFARAQPIEEFTELLAAFPKMRGRPAGSNKEQISLRIDKDILDRLRASGPGWQSRINAILRQALA